MGFCLICCVWEGILSAKQVENNSKWLKDWKCSCAAEFYISLPFLTRKKIYGYLLKIKLQVLNEQSYVTDLRKILQFWVKVTFSIYVLSSVLVEFILLVHNCWNNNSCYSNCSYNNSVFLKVARRFKKLNQKPQLVNPSENKVGSLPNRSCKWKKS